MRPHSGFDQVKDPSSDDKAPARQGALSLLNRAVEFGQRAISNAARTRTIRARNARAIVSFTFDDIPVSAATVGAAILEQAGALGTFYIAGSLCGTSDEIQRYASIDDLVRLDRQGHELGCHTYSHVKTNTLGHSSRQAEIERNQSFLADRLADLRLRNFAYPFGAVSLSSKLHLQSVFATCRGLAPGLNVGSVDLGLLKAERLYDPRVTRQIVLKQIERAEAERGWLIYCSHDVDPAPSEWGISPEILEFAVSCARERGVEILPVRNALERVAYG